MSIQGCVFSGYKYTFAALSNLLLCLSAHLPKLAGLLSVFRAREFLETGVRWLLHSHYAVEACWRPHYITVKHLYHDDVVLEGRRSLFCRRTQCWNSRHADIDFLCFQPIARYSFLSDEAEEQRDTHQLSHGARENAHTLVSLALTNIVEVEGKAFLMCFSRTDGFFSRSASQSHSSIPLSVSDTFILILISGKTEEQLKFTVCIEHQSWPVCVLDEVAVLWSSVYSVSLSFVVHKNRKIKVLEGVGGAWRHTDACVISCSKASCFLTTAHQGIQAKLKHRQSWQRLTF